MADEIFALLVKHTQEIHQSLYIFEDVCTR
jgi:hypothetical protein